MTPRLTRDYVGIFDIFDEDFILLMNGNLLAGFEIAVDPECFDEENYVFIERTFAPLFRDDRTYYLVFRRNRPSLLPHTDEKVPEVVKTLKLSVAKFLQSQSIYKERVYLFVENRIGEKIEKESKGARILLRSSSWVENEYLHEVQEYSRELSGIFEALKRISPDGVKKLKTEKISSILYSLFTLQNTDSVIKDINLFQLFSAHDVLIEDGMIKIGDRFASVVSLSSIPPYSFSDFFEAARGLDADYFITQIISPVKKTAALALMGPVTNLAAKLSSYVFLGTIAERMRRIAGMNKSIMEAIERGEQPLEFATYVVIYGNDRKRIREQREYLIGKYLEYRAQFVVENFNLLTSFFASIPGHNNLNLRRKLLISSSALKFLNLFSEGSGHRKPVVIFQTEKNTIFNLDPFSSSQEAWNFFVTGSTGSGKSFFMNYLLLNTLVYDPHLFIFDYGESYSSVIKFLKADVLKVDLSGSTVRMNPFVIPRFDKKYLQYLVLFIEALLSEGNSTELIRKVDVTSALKRAYARCGIRENDELKETATFPTLTLVREELEKINPELARKLSLWTRGSEGELYGEFFDNEEDSFSFKRIHYIEMSGFDNDPKLASVLVFVLFHKLFDTVMRTPGKKMIVLDEVWRFLLNPIMARKIEELFRTARKYGGSIGIITQHPLDVMESPHCGGILSNTQIKYFLHQKEIKDEGLWKQAFKFNSRALDILKSLKTVPGLYSEIFIWSEYIKKKVRLKVNPLLYWLFTTKEEERRIRDKYIEEYGIRQGMAKLLMDFYSEQEIWER